MPLVEIMFRGEGMVEKIGEMTQEERWVTRYKEVVRFYCCPIKIGID